MNSRFPFIRRLAELGLADRAVAGEKAARLGELTGAGFHVPPGFCVTADAYRQALAAGQLDARLTQRLKTAEIDDPVDLEQAAEEIRGWIEEVALPPVLLEELDAALSELAPAGARERFAVRSSRVAEDVPNPAASGLAQAYLAVEPAEVAGYLRKCWGLPWSSRAIYYRHRKKLDQAQSAMAVVVQPMVRADAAGVMFTANPLTASPDEIHIDGTWGLGEAVVAARCKPDHFVLKKKGSAAGSSRIVERSIAVKDVMDQSTPEAGFQTIALPPEKQSAPCLTDEQLIVLADLGEKVEERLMEPQDIEWCRVGDEFFLLQTRPAAR